MNTSNNNLIPSQAVLNLIRRSEGFSAQAYWDEGSWAIGYGHHGPSVTENTIWTLAGAEAVLLDEDVPRVCSEVKALVDVPLSQGQFSALVDFTYNLGAGRLAESTLLKELNQGHYAGAGEQLLRWDESAGAVNEGLKARREAEYALWQS